jgi:hypothetical protein
MSIVIVKTLLSIKLKGYKAPHLNILFSVQNLQNLQGTFAESTRHHWKLYLVKVYSFHRIYKALCRIYKAPLEIVPCTRHLPYIPQKSPSPKGGEGTQ